MSDSLAVVVGEILAGTVERLGDARLRFVYDDGYRSRPDATPLSLSMPLRIDSHPDRTISPWLWGLLPDNDLVLRLLGPPISRVGVVGLLVALDADRRGLCRRSPVRQT